MRIPLLLALVLISSSSRLLADPVDELIRGEMKTKRIPGAVVKVIRDGHDVKTAAYGFANLELRVRATTNSVFEIGSITKQFTASCILILQQEGRLSIEDKISKYLSNTPPAWADVTIRHLLSHTSGIKSYTGLEGFELRRHLTQEEFIKELSKQPMEFRPGESWKYCNSGFSLLGYIIENVSGESYWAFLHERILDPLEMTATTDRNPRALVMNRASGYEQTNKVHINRDYDLTDVFSAGAMVSTVGDLAKWNAALDGTRILTAASELLAWTPQRLNDGKLTKYGLGWFLESMENHRIVGHGGSTSGFSASIQRFPDDKLAVILLTNTDEGIATDLARRIARIYFGPAKSASVSKVGKKRKKL